MSMMLTPARSWTAASIDTALVHINTALACLKRHPGRTVEDRVIEEARLLKLHLEQNPSACTADALVCCRKLLEMTES